MVMFSPPLIIEASLLVRYLCKCSISCLNRNLVTFWLLMNSSLASNLAYLRLMPFKTADFFTSKRSPVFIAFLDCTKAFDRISQYCLFSTKLMDRKVPLCFLMCIIFLYMNMSSTCRWNKMESSSFDIPSGTKQGGILSPDFFSLYMNDLILLLEKCGFGCHLINMFIGCIFFADDIALISPSRHGLQCLIDVCSDYCKRFCLDFNIKKSKIMIVGDSPNEGVFSPIFIHGKPLDFVS